MVQFGGQYTFEQYKDANVALSGVRRPFRWMVWPIALVLILSGLIPMIREGEDPAQWFPVVVFLGLVAVFYGFRKRALRESFDTHKLLHRPVSGTADADGVEFVSEYGTSKTPWSVYHQARVTPKTVFLYKSTALALFLPREFFASDDDWNRFIETVRANVKAPPLAQRRNVLVLLLWVIIFMAVVVVWNSFGH